MKKGYKEALNNMTKDAYFLSECNLCFIIQQFYCDFWTTIEFKCCFYIFSMVIFFTYCHSNNILIQYMFIKYLLCS